MGSRYDSHRPVFFRDVSQHPQHVANPSAAIVGKRSHVGVQRLTDLASRVDAADIQAAELVVAEHLGNVGEYPRMGNDLLKNLAFIHEICETSAARLVFKLTAGRIALLLKELLHAKIDRTEQFG